MTARSTGGRWRISIKRDALYICEKQNYFFLFMKKIKIFHYVRQGTMTSPFCTDLLCWGAHASVPQHLYFIVYKM